MITGDASALTSQKAISDRIQLAIDLDDPDICIDLRHRNEGKTSNTFDEFFKVANLVIEGKYVAVDDRRKTKIAHMSTFVSVRYF